MEEIKEVSPGNNEEEKDDSEKANATNTPLDNDEENHTHTNQNKSEEDFIQSEGTLQMNQEINENTPNLNIYFENEMKDYIETTPAEEIDFYINNIQNRFNKSKMMRLNTQTNNKEFTYQNSENTVEKDKIVTNNLNNVVLEDICIYIFIYKFL